MRKFKSSGLKTASEASHANPVVLGGCLLLTDGANDATLVLYDNASAASGDVVAKLAIAGSDLTGGITFPFEVATANGLYAELTGVGANFILYTMPHHIPA